MSADTQAPGKLPVRLVVAVLAALVGAATLVVSLTSGTDTPNLPTDAVRQGDIAVYSAYVREPATDMAAAYFVMTNIGSSADTLLSVSSPVAASAEMHDVGKRVPTAEDGMDSGSMVPTPEVVLEPGETITLEPAGGHMMLMGISGTLQPGSTINLKLVFAKAGTITVKAPVIALTDPAPTN